MNRIGKTVLTVCVIYLGAAMVITPTGSMAAARQAVDLCMEVVLPSLFPFFVCSNLLISLGAARVLSRYLSQWMRPIFGVPGGGALAVVLGVISGYPVGAACAAQLYTSGECTREEAERLLAFCNNSGPLFVLGAVGVGMLGSQRLGILLYCAHVLAALMVGILFARRGRKGGGLTRTLPPGLERPNAKTAASGVGAAVSGAVDTALKVCGFVLVFAVFAAALPHVPGREYAYALLEITGGIRALLGTGLEPRLLLSLVSMFLAFSGISVLMQVIGVISPCGLSVAPYVKGKLLQAALAFVFTWVFLGLFPTAIPAFALDITLITIPTPRELLVTAFMSILWSVVALVILTAAAWYCDRHEK